MGIGQSPNPQSPIPIDENEYGIKKFNIKNTK